jgi:hypothetical protein
MSKKNFGGLQRNGFTLIDLFAAIFVLTIPSIVFNFSKPRLGLWWGILISFVAAVASLVVVSVMYRTLRIHITRVYKSLEITYPSIYRVLALPDDNLEVRKEHGVEISIGDFGWEAEPIKADGLIYLHGLTSNWEVAWYAGFRSDQLELVGLKPHTQYFLPHHWKHAWASNPRCPFPVKVTPKVRLGYAFPRRGKGT